MEDTQYILFPCFFDITQYLSSLWQNFRHFLEKNLTLLTTDEVSYVANTHGSTLESESHN